MSVPKTFQELFLYRSYFSLKRRKKRRKSSGKARYRAHKELARALVGEKLAHFNELYHFTYNRVVIKNSKTRWGSCSANKNLNFNYKIVFLPPGLQDYLVVHELCHLGELNHSAAFWELVSRAIPEYQKLRAQLRKIRI